jgi:hypothetical protein
MWWESWRGPTVLYNVFLISNDKLLSLRNCKYVRLLKYLLLMGSKDCVHWVSIQAFSMPSKYMVSVGGRIGCWDVS